MRRRVLLVLLLMLASYGVGERAGQADVVVFDEEEVEAPHKPKDAGSVGSGAGCDFAWITCWKTA